MNRYMENEIVFGEKWFEKHQQKLLWLLNTPIVRLWFRWIMRIRKYDCATIINRITPNSISYNVKVINDKLEITTDFRTHDKYSKRLYFAFKPLWYLLHIIDWSLFDRYESLTKLNFGFSTLTVYPASGANSPVDGWVSTEGSGVTFANLISKAGTSAGPNASPAYFIYAGVNGNTNGSWWQMYRSIFCFDTSALTSGATISAAVLSLASYSTAPKYDDFTTPADPNIDIYLSTPANTNNLVAGDYGQIGSTSQTGSPITYTNWTTNGSYNDFTFNATGIGNISKTGISKFGARNANHDVAASSPTWSAFSSYYLQGYFAEAAGTTSDPKLVVTYSVVVGPANVKTYQGVASASVKTLQGVAIAYVKSSQGVV